MIDTRLEDRQPILRFSNEEEFFSMIERRYQEQGYELLETQKPIKPIANPQLTRKNAQDFIGLEFVYA